MLDKNQILIHLDKQSFYFFIYLFVFCFCFFKFLLIRYNYKCHCYLSASKILATSVWVLCAPKRWDNEHFVLSLMQARWSLIMPGANSLIVCFKDSSISQSAEKYFEKGDNLNMIGCPGLPSCHHPFLCMTLDTYNHNLLLYKGQLSECLVKTKKSQNKYLQSWYFLSCHCIGWIISKIYRKKKSLFGSRLAQV